MNKFLWKSKYSIKIKSYLRGDGGAFAGSHLYHDMLGGDLSVRCGDPKKWPIIEVTSSVNCGENHFHYQYFRTILFSKFNLEL